MEGGRRVRGHSRLAVIAAVAGVPVLLSGCGNAPSSPAPPVGVSIKASDTACVVAQDSFESGNQTFAVSNAGSQVTEVFVYASDERVVGEVSDIGPSTSKRLTVALKPGEYEIACRPGMVGKDIRTPISVKGPSGTPSASSPELDAALATYRRYIVAQAELLQARTKPFVAAVQARDISQAKSLYATAHIPYQTIVPIAQELGDLDSRIDARIDDVENGQVWTGFHRLEYDLWKKGDLSQDGGVASQLSADVANLADQVQRVELTPDEIGSAAKSLMDGVAATEITGDEERYSGLDLVDVSASVDGSYLAYLALRPLIITVQPSLVTKLDTRFGTLKADLAAYGHGASFDLYDTLSKSQINALSDDIQALRGPLTQLASAAQKE